MNQQRYEELVGRILDDEASPEEMEEFLSSISESRDGVADFQLQLVLWDLWSQQCRPERNADAFVAAWRTRLAAEAEGDSFVEQTMEGLQAKRRASGTLVASLLGLVDMAKRWLWVRCIAAVVVLCVASWMWLFGPAVGEPMLSEVAGTGLILERGDQRIPALSGTRLLAGDVLQTPSNAVATIIFKPERTRIVLASGAQLQILPWTGGKRFALLTGKLEVSAARQRPFSPMVLQTPVAEARVVGTKFSLLTSDSSSRLEVTDGKVRFTKLSDQSTVTVPAGKYAVAEAKVLLAPLPLTGSVLREYWTNIPGLMWTDLLALTNYPGHADDSSCLTNYAVLETPSNAGTNYGQRLRGFIHPPKTGQYSFWIAARGTASLYLSPDDNPDHKVHMANCPGGTQPRQWGKSQAQHSSTVELTAGKKYYFEVIHKAGIGENNLAVAWQGPNQPQEVISMQNVSPFKQK